MTARQLLTSAALSSAVLAGLLLAAAVEARAQGAFPAPLPSQSAASAQSSSPFPPVNSSASPFPPVNGSDPAFERGAAPLAGAGGLGGQPAGQPPGAEQCMKEFLPLRQDAEKKAAAIKAAGARKAPPEEACKLISSFAGAEVKMISFIDTNSRKCGIPPEIGKQLKSGHANTEKMKTTVCNVAQQRAQGAPAGPSLSDVLGTSSAIPEVRASRRGGATFDTLNGNALAR